MSNKGENLDKFPFRFDLQLFSDAETVTEEEVAPEGEEELNIPELGVEELFPEESEEPQGSKPKGSESTDDATEFVIDGKTFTVKDFNRMYSRDQDIKGEQRNLHDWGKKLNDREKNLTEREERLKDVEGLEELQQAKRVLEANPEAYEYLRQLVAKGGGEISPRLKQLEDKLTEQSEDLKTQQAKVELGKALPDFNYDEVIDFMENVDWDDRKAVMLFQYWAKIGSRLEEIVQERLAKTSEQDAHRPGLPPLAGGKKVTPAEVPDSIEGIIRAVEHDLQSGAY